MCIISFAFLLFSFCCFLLVFFIIIIIIVLLFFSHPEMTFYLICFSLQIVFVWFQTMRDSKDSGSMLIDSSATVGI